MSTIEFHKPGDLPQDVLRFWRERIMAQNPTLALTGSPEWYAIMVAAGSTDAVVVVVRRDDGTCVAILPLLFRTWSLDFRLAGCCWKVKDLYVAKVFGGILIEDDLLEEQIKAIWEDVGERFPRVDAYWLDHVLEGPGTEKIRRSVCSTPSHFLCTIFDGLPHYCLAMPPPDVTSHDFRSKDTMKRLERYKNAIASAAGGALHLIEIRQEKDWRGYEDRVESMMSASWQARLLGHGFRFENLGPVVERGYLRSFLLMAGEDAVAFLLAYQGMGVFNFQQTGYSRKYAKFGPGRILMHSLIEYIFEKDRPAYVDFGEGEADFKRLFANQKLKTTAFLVVRRRKGFRLLFWLRRWCVRTDVLLRNLMDRFHLKRLLVKKMKQSGGR